MTDPLDEVHAAVSAASGGSSQVDGSCLQADHARGARLRRPRRPVRLHDRRSDLNIE